MTRGPPPTTPAVVPTAVATPLPTVAVILPKLLLLWLNRPPNNGPALPLPPKDFKPVLALSHDHAAIDYVPAGIVSFTYPDYPLNSVAWGSVIVQVAVDRREKLRVLKSFTTWCHLRTSPSPRCGSGNFVPPL
jgi:hypothetical protein